MITSNIQKSGPAPGARLAKAVGLALATLATSSAFALPVVTSPLGASQDAKAINPFILNAAFPTITGTASQDATARGSTTPANSIAYTNGRWWDYFAFKLVPDANSVSIRAGNVGTALGGLLGNVYSVTGCTPTSGSSGFTTTCSTPTLFSAMTLGPGGLSVYLPPSGSGFVNATSNQFYLIEVSGTDQNSNSYTVDVNSQKVPAPAALGLLGIGLMGMGLTRRRSGVGPSAGPAPV